ncbi:polysaccharide deacetylase family protein [Pseudalkalibacillus salsuginis]|uniref:polysaccharide deacetylase family protein n=1 Tax=Pseudalkalibacillus salsuginis TaxID=2910972 RepID=UPI001F3A46DA|nr:polysaccharide deacetylase family protein [Pseudalkalibacillus salsuginis]MCF6412049.1 polysaccharide deacetylase family protein [Pseudalkalibacillus salsuginis]
MRKTIMGMLVLLLVGCGVQDTHQDEHDQKEDPPNASEETNQSGEKNTENQNQDGNEDDDKEQDPPKEPEEPPVITYTIHPANWTLKTDVDTEDKVVLLTIDDAPDKHALEMAKKLKAIDVPAIFFVNGHFMDTDEEKDIVKEIHEMGFEIGNHTMSHANLRNSSEEEQRYEIVTLSEEIEALTGKAPRFFRAPFGINTEFSKELIEEQGMLFMNWTYGYDWEKEYQTGESIADIMVNTPLLTNGAILLMHDRDWTNEGLNDIVKGLQNKGYIFIHPDQIVK